MPFEGKGRERGSEGRERGREGKRAERSEGEVR